MIDAEVVRERLRALQSYVDELRRLGPVSMPELERNVERRWAVLHGLQLAIECVQDVAVHIAATEGLGAPTNHTDAIDLLGEGGILDETLHRSVRRMPGFRNVIVHEYLAVDLDRVLEAWDRLGDFEAFVDAVSVLLD